MLQVVEQMSVAITSRSDVVIVVGVGGYCDEPIVADGFAIFGLARFNYAHDPRGNDAIRERRFVHVHQYDVRRQPNGIAFAIP